MDKKISALDPVTLLNTGDVLPIVNELTTKKVTVSQIIDGLATTVYVNSQDALKVDKIVGKGLSTEDYTTAEKSKLAGIATGAEVNVNADWNAVSGDAQILNKPTIPSVTGFVPYTGATGNVDLGEFGLATGQVTLDTTPTGTPAVGTTQWNDSLGSSQTTLKGGTVILKNGVDLVARIVNKVTPNTTLTKASYQAVRVSGATGQRLSVELAKGDADLNSADTIGLVAETIATNQEGFIITMGQIENINTTGSLQSETWVDGDVLYLSPTTAGRLTNIKPTGATGHIVVIGYVEYAHINQGKIYVKIMNGWELDELHNVYINSATLANNDLLQYDSTSELWKNETLSSAGIQPTITLTTTGTSGASTLVGATLNIPQYSGGGSSTQSAFTILANNTNATALPTEQVYKEVAEQSLSGTGMIATGGTLPSGTQTHSYRWSQIGNLVTVRINLQFGTAGICSGIAIPFANMSDIPQIPQHPTIFATALDVINYGSGQLSNAKTFPIFTTAPGQSAIRIKTIGSPNTYEFLVGRVSSSYNFAWINIQYYI